jgi:hypothetical protein
MSKVAGAVLAAFALTVAGCGGDEPSLSAWCGVVADGAVVPLDSADAPRRWDQLERLSPDDLRADVERLRVAADQVARLAPGDLTKASMLVLTPRVLDAHGRVVAGIGSRCRIDVSTLTVISPSVP